MKGLLKKDLLMIRQSWIILILVLLIVLGVTIYFKRVEILISFMPIFGAMQGSSTITTDRMTDWNVFETVLPIKKSSEYLEKFMLTILLWIFGLFIALLMAWILPFETDAETLKINVLMAVIYGFGTNSILIYLLYRLKKSQFFMCYLLSFVLPVLATVYWTSQFEMVTKVNALGIAVMEMNLQLPLLSYFALGCVLLFIAEMIFGIRHLCSIDQA